MVCCRELHDLYNYLILLPCSCDGHDALCGLSNLLLLPHPYYYNMYVLPYIPVYILCVTWHSRMILFIYVAVFNILIILYLLACMQQASCVVYDHPAPLLYI